MTERAEPKPTQYAVNAVSSALGPLVITSHFSNNTQESPTDGI